MNELITIQAENSIAQTDILDHLGNYLKLNVAEGDVSDHTLRSIYTGIDMFVTWSATNGINPAMATDDDIKAYRRYLVHEKEYAPQTVASKLYAIRKFYEVATWRGLRPDNPAMGIKGKRDESDPADKVKFLPYEGFKKLLNTPDKTVKGRRDRAILALMGLHGLRVFEVASLSLDSFNDDNSISIAGKRKKQRKIYLTPNSKQCIDEWLENRSTQDHSHIFISLGNRSHGKPLCTRAIRHMVDGYLEQCGLSARGISCHSLRHSFATWSLYLGAKIEHVQATMGHASRDTTAIYQGVVDRVKNNPALMLDNLISEAN